VALLLASCAHENAGANDYASTVTGLIQEAESSTASERQLAVLNQAAIDGTIPVQAMTELLGDYAACLENAGWRVTVGAPEEEPPGSDLFRFPMQAAAPSRWTEDQAALVDNDCAAQSWMYASAAYNSTPNALHWINLPWESPSVIECLRERGYTVGADASGLDINIIATQDALAHANDPGYVTCDPYTH